MALKPWKKISEAVAAKNPWWTYRRDVVELPSGASGEYHYVHTNGSSLVIPVLPDGNLLLVRQYRYLAARESVEFPCGSVKDGSTADRTAWEELAEETGYSAKQLIFVGQFNPYNGVTDEMCSVYLAKELSYVGPSPDETEEIETVTMSAADLDGLIGKNVVWDGMTAAAWSIVRAKKLF
jgi:ADP-ribose pyrophosphatase